MLHHKLSCAKTDSSYQPGVWTCVTLLIQISGSRSHMQSPDFQNSAFTGITLSLLTGLERKGNFALLVQFAVMGMSAPKLVPDCQCIHLVQHCAGIPALLLLRVLGRCPAGMQHSSSSKTSCQCQSCSHPAPECACAEPGYPATSCLCQYVCVCLSSCVSKTQS